jgi:hypothetical protein
MNRRVRLLAEIWSPSLTPRERVMLAEFWRVFRATFELFENPTTLRQETPNTMAGTEAAPAQYKQPSRKGKRAWRKNVDVTQVQSGLEDVRDQLIQG